MGTVFHSLEKPCLFLLSFLVCVVYIAGVTAASIPTGWPLLITALPLMLMFYNKPLTFALSTGCLFLAYAAFSLFWSPNIDIGYFWFLQLLVCGLTVYVGMCISDFRPVLYGFALGLMVNNVIAILQYFGISLGIFTMTAAQPSGLLVNPNVYCELSVILLVALIVERLWWLTPVTFPALLMVHSRAAILALTIGFGIWLWSKSKLGVLALICVFVILIHFLGYGKISSIDQRFDLWRDTIQGLTLFGNGSGSFEILFPYYATHLDTIIDGRPRYAHNDILQFAFEYGIGVLLLIPIAFNILKSKLNERFVVYVVAIISAFSFPFHMAALAFIACLYVGYLNRLCMSYGYSRRAGGLVLFTGDYWKHVNRI